MLRAPDGDRQLRAWDVAVFRRGSAGAHEVRNDTADLVRVLAPGDFVAFPEGEPGAHQLRNDGETPFRALIGSTKSGVYVAGYPDSGKLLVDAPMHGKRAMLRDAPELD